MYFNEFFVIKDNEKRLVNQKLKTKIIICKEIQPIFVKFHFQQ